jgi:hypothetical protein
MVAVVRLNPTMTYETEERLKSFLDTNQLARERLCLALLSIDKRFSNVRPRHPRGGPDGGRDIEALFRGSERAFGAVGFLNQANDSDEQGKRIRRKFEDDLQSAINSQGVSVFIFFTNASVTIREKAEMDTLARSKGITYCDVLDRERLRILLDSPDGFSIRFQYLGIPLSGAEQATFFAKWGDDIQGVISEGFGKLERTLNRLQFLAETTLPLSHLTITLELDREYLGAEIGHFRAFCSIELVEPRDGLVGLLFGSADNSNRMDARGVEDLSLAGGGIERGQCGRQWEKKLPDGGDVPGPFTRTKEFLKPAGSFTRAGVPTVRKLAIQFDGATDFFRIPPYLLLRDIDDARFALFLNRSLADKLASICVYANEYELARYPREKLRIDGPPESFRVPMCFAESELVDVWVRIMHDLSTFRVSFSDWTPRRRFSAAQVGDSPSP